MARRVALIAVATASTLALPSRAVDFSACTAALEGVRSGAEEAAGKARDAESAEDELQAEKDDYDNCRRFPDIYDLLQDGCRSKRSGVESAQDELESAIGDLRRALDELDTAMSDVQGACGYSFVPAAPLSGVSPARQGICARLRKLRTAMTPQKLAELCKGVMSETECNLCLSAP